MSDPWDFKHAPISDSARKQLTDIGAIPVDDGWRDQMQKRLRRLMRLLQNNQERYVRAWMAATGIPPAEACIVTNMQPNGEVMVVKRRDEVLTCCKCHEPIIKEGFLHRVGRDFDPEPITFGTSGRSWADVHTKMLHIVVPGDKDPEPGTTT